MPLWRRREETLNEKLAREAGLSLAGGAPTADEELERQQADANRVAELFRSARGALSDVAAVHGPHRHREWDAVATVSAPGIRGDAVHFVALPEGDLVVDEDVPDHALEALAASVESALEAPYRAEAVRRGVDIWAVAARTIQVVELPPYVDGDEVEVAVHEGEHTTTVDGMPADLPLGSLARLVDDRHPSYVVRATRLDDRLWEAEVFAL